ncbi:rngB [Symbiodinium sp. CCMP2592]|nr:rngB [Symbiodinium sp. CCMP2592]
MQAVLAALFRVIRVCPGSQDVTLDAMTVMSSVGLCSDTEKAHRCKMMLGEHLDFETTDVRNAHSRMHSHGFVSLFRSHTIRAALLILKLVSAAATNALFFSGSAMSGSSDDGCVPETFAERIWRATIIGILSAFVGDVLIVLLALVQRRRVIVRERWTPKARARQLRSWRLRSFLFWLLWFLDCGLSVTYILVFLANVSATDGRKWIESTGMSLLQDLVLKPFYLAFGYGTIASIVLCCSSRIREKVATEWQGVDQAAVARENHEAHELGHALRLAWEVESIDSAKLVRNQIQIESF